MQFIFKPLSELLSVVAGLVFGGLCVVLNKGTSNLGRVHCIWASTWRTDLAGGLGWIYMKETSAPKQKYGDGAKKTRRDLEGP